STAPAGWGWRPFRARAFRGAGGSSRAAASPPKRAPPRGLGAPPAVDASTADPVKAIRELTGPGVDYAFEAIGLKKAAEQAFECLRPGGTATVVGMIPVGQKIELDGPAFLREKKVQGCSMGSNRFKVDMPRYVELYRQGRLKLDEMITRRGRLEDVNEAFRAMKAGEVARTVLMFDYSGPELQEFRAPRCSPGRGDGACRGTPGTRLAGSRRPRRRA